MTPESGSILARNGLAHLRHRKRLPSVVSEAACSALHDSQWTMILDAGAGSVLAVSGEIFARNEWLHDAHVPRLPIRCSSILSCESHCGHETGTRDCAESVWCADESWMAESLGDMCGFSRCENRR